MNNKKAKDSVQKVAGTIREKEYLEAILNGIKHKIFLIDRDYRILQFNKAALGKDGDLKDVTGAHCYGKFEGRDSICGDCPAAVTFRTGEVLHILRRCNLPSEVIYKISSYPVFNSKGEIVRAVLSARDVTEIHKVEQIKNDLMKMLTHDIRNPLLAITQTLDNCLKTDISHSLIEETRDNCELLLNMIDDVLDIYRHENDKFVISKREVDLLRVIKASIKLVDTLMKDKNIRIDLHLPKSLLSLIADENRLIRVIINLLENAIMYSPGNGKISIDARYERNRIADRRKRSFNLLPHIKVSITDEGIGIPSEEIERIFERYYRVERKENGWGMGLGLGLTFCKQTIEAHGGRIWAESPVSKGRGSRFVFTLPLSKPVNSG